MVPKKTLLLFELSCSAYRFRTPYHTHNLKLILFNLPGIDPDPQYFYNGLRTWDFQILFPQTWVRYTATKSHSLGPPWLYYMCCPLEYG
jgi:hypothetical protein